MMLMFDLLHLAEQSMMNEEYDEMAPMDLLNLPSKKRLDFHGLE